MVVDYYPEHWERSMWEQDARLMRDTGVLLIRVAEFAWSRLEPEEGRYASGWLFEVEYTRYQSLLTLKLIIALFTPQNLKVWWEC
ncbi:beta-galactosidase [Paenibacillus sp. FSL H7-0326]|nr:beta-galactosidase [Paenibacillus sp. FSL H7-0326]